MTNKKKNITEIFCINDCFDFRKYSLYLPENYVTQVHSIH